MLSGWTSRFLWRNQTCDLLTAVMEGGHVSIFFIFRQISYDSVTLCRDWLTETHKECWKQRMNDAKDDVSIAAKYCKNLCLVSEIFLNDRTFQWLLFNFNLCIEGTCINNILNGKDQEIIHDTNSTSQPRSKTGNSKVFTLLVVNYKLIAMRKTMSQVGGRKTNLNKHEHKCLGHWLGAYGIRVPLYRSV